MNLSTTYLGLELKNPIVPSSSPLMSDVANIKRMEDAGAAAIVLHSLFEEQITNEALELHYHTTQGTESFAEAITYFPEPTEYRLGTDDYIEHIAKVKKTIEIPVIASLNGVSSGGWTKYARLMEEAGADALELNLYYVATDPMADGNFLEAAYLATLMDVRSQIKIPIAVKLSPFYTSLPNMAKKLVDAGANGLVLFNRFYQPDFDIEELKVKSNIILSQSSMIRLSLRWIAILHGRLSNVSMAATGGVHNGSDAIKLFMAGADVAYTCSALLKEGPGAVARILSEVSDWMTIHEYESVEQMKGSMSQKSVADPGAFERALYLKELQSFH